MSGKQALMESVRTILSVWGLEDGTDYVMSFQGPTMILSMAGQEKITEDQRKKIEEAGMAILG